MTRISKSCAEPNPLMVERQDPDNFPRFQTRERCALEKAAYVFKLDKERRLFDKQIDSLTCDIGYQ